MIQNKKADVSITILVIGIVAIFTLTISSFLWSNATESRNFAGIGLIETINSVSDEIAFSKNTDFKLDYQNSIDYGNVKISISQDEKGNIIVSGQSYRKNSLFNNGDEKLLVNVSYYKR